MSKMPRRQRTMKTIDENKASPIDEEEMKEKLKLEIRLLKLHISQHMRNDTMRFEDIRMPQIDIVTETSKANSSHLIDVEAEIRNELYIMAGFCCKRMGDQFIFVFQSSENGMHSNKNWIELIKIEERWQLGKWVMPLSVDVQVIFAKYTIHSAASMKFFLKECKHALACYHRREYEFMKLKAFLQGPRCVSLQTNYAYTRITLNLVKAVCQSSEEARYIIVILDYKKQEARPHRVIIDCEGENPLSETETKVLKALFKTVKDQGLKEGMEKILTSDRSPFIWKQDSKDNSIIDENVEEDSDEGITFLKILKKGRKPKKKQREILCKNDENDNEVDRCENDLTIDSAGGSNVESNEEDVSPVDIPETGKKRSKNASSQKKYTLHQINTNVKSDEKPKICPEIAKKSFPITNRSDDVSKTGQNDGKRPKSIVPEMFRPKAKPMKGFLEEISAAEIQLQKSAKGGKKTGNSSQKTPLSAKNPAVTPGNRSHAQLTCSTPIVGRPINLSPVAEKNISAIVKENMIKATEITEIEKVHDASAHNDFDEFSSNESGSEDITEVKNSQKELLKDLQAVKDNATVTNKTLKRKSRSLAGGKKQSRSKLKS